MPSKILSAALIGLETEIIEVEADSGGGDFGHISIVGLPDATVSEAKERVKSALRNCGLEYPRRKITVNLAPANIRKHGPAYDLPIAVSILSLRNIFKVKLCDSLIIGELSLTGDVRPVNGVLSIALKAKESGIKNIYVPVENALEAKLISDLHVYPVKNLKQIINHFQGKQIISELFNNIIKIKNSPSNNNLSDIIGQEKAKRALEIAATGGHNLLLYGPPGSGKTMIAKCLPSIMPPLSYSEILEITKIYSVAGLINNLSTLVSSRPFRSPHHSASNIALVGGGSWPKPGEISLAHRGVLFLDEFPEFSRYTLDNLRQPIEEGYINICRASGSLKFPAKFILIAAMNPCPCGYFGDKTRTCSCRPQEIVNYKRKISGPLLDRIDMHIEMPRIDLNEITSNLTTKSENSEAIKLRVLKAHKLVTKRAQNNKYSNNSEMTSDDINKYCQLDSETKIFFQKAATKLLLSARSYFRILKVARTIADLENSQMIKIHHLAEALQYRSRLE